MIFNEYFSNISFWILFLLSVLVVLIAVEVGLRFGRWSRNRKRSETDAPIGTMVGAMLGLLAFILAFTFQMASSNYEARRMEVLKESNAIGTAYLRADFMPEPDRTEIRGLLREYVNTRLDAAKWKKLEVGIARSEEILHALWIRVSTLADKNSGTVLTGLFVSALNDVIDIHSERLMLAQKRIPEIIWIALLFVTFFSMLAVGYQFGIDGTRSVLGALVLALTFSAVIFLIEDLDSPRKGLITVSQAPMLDLRKSLNKIDAMSSPMAGATAVVSNVPFSEQKQKGF